MFFIKSQVYFELLNGGFIIHLHILKPCQLIWLFQASTLYSHMKHHSTDKPSKRFKSRPRANNLDLQYEVDVLSHDFHTNGANGSGDDTGFSI